MRAYLVVLQVEEDLRDLVKAARDQVVLSHAVRHVHGQGSLQDPGHEQHGLPEAHRG